MIQFCWQHKSMVGRAGGPASPLYRGHRHWRRTLPFSCCIWCDSCVLVLQIPRAVFGPGHAKHHSGAFLLQLFLGPWAAERWVLGGCYLELGSPLRSVFQHSGKGRSSSSHLSKPWHPLGRRRLLISLLWLSGLLFIQQLALFFLSS